MLEIVFLNLLMNSAQAMNGAGRIQVDITAHDDACEITFTDSRPGIPADIRDQVLTPFFTTKSRGTGLGLATAKSVIDAHHGEIAVDCPATGGTIVTVRLRARLT